MKYIYIYMMPSGCLLTRKEGLCYLSHCDFNKVQCVVAYTTTALHFCGNSVFVFANIRGS